MPDTESPPTPPARFPDAHAPDSPILEANVLGANALEADAQEATSIRRRRLLFRATHRGTQENDLLVGGFVRARLEALTDCEMDALEMLMELPDVDLADWLTGRRPIPEAVDCRMLQALRAAALARA